MPIVGFDVPYSLPYQQGFIGVELFDVRGLARETVKLLKDYEYRKKMEEMNNDMVLKDERIGEDENKLAQYEVEFGENQQKLKEKEEIIGLIQNEMNEYLHKEYGMHLTMVADNYEG